MKIVVNTTFGVFGVSKKIIIENDNEPLMVELFEKLIEATEQNYIYGYNTKVELYDKNGNKINCIETEF
jgi:hypothetical protein